MSLGRKISSSIIVFRKPCSTRFTEKINHIYGRNNDNTSVLHVVGRGDPYVDSRSRLSMTLKFLAGSKMQDITRCHGVSCATAVARWSKCLWWWMHFQKQCLSRWFYPERVQEVWMVAWHFCSCFVVARNSFMRCVFFRLRLTWGADVAFLHV